MEALDLVHLPDLMKRGQGRPEVAIALIDGPVASGLRELASAAIREIPGKLKGTCARADTVACAHGTFVAGILAAQRGSFAPAICPRCTLLLRPIFAEAPNLNGHMPSAKPDELADAIVDSVEAGAKVINLSAALGHPSANSENRLEQALAYAAQRGTMVVAAAGNQGTVGSSAITRHPWVMPVAACNLRGAPLVGSNLGSSIGRWGLAAPGENIISLGADGKPQTSAGTSAAAPFVTGAIALLWSEFPRASATQIKLAVTQASPARRQSIFPPLLDAWAAHQVLASDYGKRQAS